MTPELQIIISKICDDKTGALDHWCSVDNDDGVDKTLTNVSVDDDDKVLKSHTKVPVKPDEVSEDEEGENVPLASEDGNE